jgi:membrane protease YdiL (CAAX protease family)
MSGVEDRRFGALGFAWTSRTTREIAAGFILGGVGLACAVIVLLAAGALSYVAEPGTARTWIQTICGHLAVFAVAAAAEEAVFRGYAFQVIARAFGPIGATLGTSAVFAVAHAGNPNVTVFALVNIFLAGVLLGVAYLRSMSLWFATAVHTGWNWTMASLFDLPVSGLAMFRTPLYEPVQHGQRWLGGGAFGPEGGAAGSAGLLVALILLVWWIRPRIAPEMAALRPLAARQPLAAATAAPSGNGDIA